MKNYKIKVNDEAESKEAQELFEQLGFKWAGDYPENGDWYSHLYAEKSTCCHLPIYVWNGLGDKFQELTLPQLLDLVVLHRNDVKDATHTDGERKGFLSSDGVEYFWNAYDLEWFKAKQMTFAYEKFKPIQEQGLISGADALRALADGEVVEYEVVVGRVWNAISSMSVNLILNDNFRFRLKPRTIKLSIEIPAPFEPKDGDTVWFLNDDDEDGYGSARYNSGLTSYFGWWSTEEEIKQVVAVLRGGIKA